MNRKSNAARKTAVAQSIETLEDRRLMSVTIKGTDITNISDANGNKANGQNVVVKFSGTVTAPDYTKITMFGYSNDTVAGGQHKQTINIKSATLNSDKKSITLLTDVLIRKGSQITLKAGAMKDADNADVTGTIRTSKGLNRDRFTLAERAFKPNDPTYFSSGVISGGKADVVANTAPGTDDPQVLSDLTSFLAKKVKDKLITTAQRDSALALYNSDQSKSIAAPANLRAAIVSLVGTVGEPAMNALLGTANSTGKVPITIQFNTADISSGAKDAELLYTSKGRLKLTFASDYGGESFVALSGRMAREIMHDDSATNHNDKQSEEVAANFVESVVYAQQIVEDFTYAQKGTTYTLYQNYHLYTLLNSGDRQFPRVGTSVAPLKGSTSDSSNVANPGFTGNSDYAFANSPSFDATVRSKYDGRISPGTTSMNALQATILNNITGNKYTSSTLFDDNLLKSIDTTQDTLGDAFVMRVARVLQLKTFN